MFVTMSRAKQYETVISGRNPSVFMRELSGERYSTIPDTDFDPMAHRPALAERPCLSGYEKRRRKLSVHDIMDFSSDDGTYGMGEGCDEVCGKGKEYGTRIHEMAQMMCRGMVVNEDEYPELPRIRRILDSASDADLRLSEVECGLPVDKYDTNLRGQIDLLVVYPDRIEIHDYKTDVTDRFETEYKVQLSIYAHAAGGFYGKPVRCFIDYVSRDIPAVDFEPLPMSLIEERVQRAILPIR